MNKIQNPIVNQRLNFSRNFNELRSFDSIDNQKHMTYWSESLLFAWRNQKFVTILWVPCKDSDEPA